jgi:hypothetical protein
MIQRVRGGFGRPFFCAPPERRAAEQARRYNSQQTGSAESWSASALCAVCQASAGCRHQPNRAVAITVRPLP